MRVLAALLAVLSLAPSAFAQVPNCANGVGTKDFAVVSEMLESIGIEAESESLLGTRGTDGVQAQYWIRAKGGKARVRSKAAVDVTVTAEACMVDTRTVRMTGCVPLLGCGTALLHAAGNGTYTMKFPDYPAWDCTVSKHSLDVVQ